MALLAAGVTGLLVWAAWSVPEAVSSRSQGPSDSRAPDVDTAAVGDSSPTAPLASVQAPSKQKPIAQTPTFQPHHGQARPDEKGRCPGPKQLAIKGACWVVLRTGDAKECAAAGHDFLEGRCYVPVFTGPRQPPPTSGPADAR